jgi:SAM-dependent methyltransferase
MGTEHHLERAFGAAAEDHYEWQTRGPYVAEREAELVRSAFLPLGERLLDLGCAEGATLHHLGEPPGAVGVDLFPDKLAFARAHLPRCTFVEGNAYALPFEDESFDHVIVRDVIHHIDEPERARREIARVLVRGGRVDVLEPCRYNPLILVHALTKPEERGELRSTMTFLTELLAADFEVIATARHQALPIHRIVFHPALGRPALGEVPLVTGAVRGFERLMDRVLPRFTRAYLHVRAVRR